MEAIINSIINGQWVQAREKMIDKDINFKELYKCMAENGFSVKDAGSAIAVLADMEVE